MGPNFESWQHCPKKVFLNEKKLCCMLIVMQEIEALHLVQDKLLRIDGVMTFNITADLILVITGAYGK